MDVHDRAQLMVRGKPTGPASQAFLSWRFVLVAIGMLGAVGMGIVLFAGSAG